jgi:hypothetical protein
MPNLDKISGIIAVIYIDPNGTRRAVKIRGRVSLTTTQHESVEELV